MADIGCLMIPGPAWMPSGTISASVFITPDPTSDFHCKQAATGDRPVGIAQEGAHDPPGVSGSSAAAGLAELGKFMSWGPGSVAPLLLGSSAVKTGDFLRPDANGAGIPCGSSTEGAGALALESSNGSEIIRVFVLSPSGASASIQAITANTTFTAADAGKVVLMNAADITATLPPATDGLRFIFISTANGAGGSTGVQITPNGTERIMGSAGSVAFTSAAGKGAINTHATAKEGDSMTLIGTTKGGITGWYIQTSTGVWARQA